MADKKWIDNRTLEDVRIVFRNFSGAKGVYNAEGDRNFCVILEPELAESMARDGWSLKELKPRDEGDSPTPYIKVKVNFNGRPPNIVTITSRGRTRLSEDEVAVLDYADIKKVDLVLNPYSWTNAKGESGVTAYLKTIFVTLNEDALELKYADVPDSGQSAREYEPLDDDEAAELAALR